MRSWKGSMPDLSTLPAGSRVFVDTNIFDLHFRNVSSSCSLFLERVAQEEITAYVNIQVLSDLLHKLMLTEAFARRYISSRSASKLKDKLKGTPAIASTLVDYQRHFETVLSLGINVLPVDERLLRETKFERATYGLMTGDSIHLGTMNRCRMARRKEPLRDIVTQDGDFALIAGLTVWKPEDVIREIVPAPVKIL